MHECSGSLTEGVIISEGMESVENRKWKMEIEMRKCFLFIFFIIWK